MSHSRAVQSSLAVATTLPSGAEGHRPDPALMPLEAPPQLPARYRREPGGLAEEFRKQYRVYEPVARTGGSLAKSPESRSATSSQSVRALPH